MGLLRHNHSNLSFRGDRVAVSSVYSNLMFERGRREDSFLGKKKVCSKSTISMLSEFPEFLLQPIGNHGTRFLQLHRRTTH